MPILKSALAVQTGCPKCNRVNKPGATRCAGCRAPLPGNLRVESTPTTDLDDLTGNLEPEEAVAEAVIGAHVEPVTFSEVGSSTHNTGGLDTALDGWLLKTDEPPDQPQPVSVFSPRLLSEKQNPGMARLCYDHTVGLIDEKEQIEYIVTVDQPEPGNSHVCAVATNKRVVIYDSMGTSEIDLARPQVCFWQDIDEIYFEEDPEISLRFIGISGWHIELKDIYPPQARRLYIYGVDHSERVLRNRVEQHMASHAGAPYISGSLDESQLEPASTNDPNTPTSEAATPSEPIVPRKSRSEADPISQAQPAPELSPVEAKPANPVLDSVMRAAQADDNAPNNPASSSNPSSSNLAGHASSPLSASPIPPATGGGSVVQNIMRMAQMQDSGVISDALSGRLTEVYTSAPLPVPPNPPPFYEHPTGRLVYGYDGATGPMPRYGYDPTAMSGPLPNHPPAQYMPQGMPYMHPSQQPYPAPGQYPPQADPQPQYGQPQYAPYPNQYPPYGQVPPAYPQQMPQQPPPADGTDVVVRLQKLKQMLDTGLITEEDYQTKKTQILADM